MIRSPLAPIQGKASTPNKFRDGSALKENTSPNRSTKQSKASRKAKENTGDTTAVPVVHIPHNRSTLKTGSLKGVGSNNLLTRLAATYRSSCDIFSEIYREKADILDYSPMKTVCDGDATNSYQEISKYCGEKSSYRDGVEIDPYHDISTYYMDKMQPLSISAELQAIKNEKEDLLVENNDLRDQIEFKSACYIQAEASIASMMKLIKEKEEALEEYDEFLRMNNTLNGNIVTSLEQQYKKQVHELNKRLGNSNDEIELLRSKLESMERNWVENEGTCKYKDRQHETAKAATNLNRVQWGPNFSKDTMTTQSCRIEYLMSLNDQLNEVLSSLTMMLHEKEQALDNYSNSSKRNEEINIKFVEEMGKTHSEELQHNDDIISGLLGLIERQRYEKAEKMKLQLEVEAMKLRLDSYDSDNHILMDTHVVIAVMAISSGLLLLFWIHVVSDIKCF